MFVISVIGVLLGIGLVWFLGVKCNRYTLERFEYAFFTKSNLIIYGIASLLLLVGFKWYEYATADVNRDIWNGIILMALSALIYLSMIIYNIKKTNLLIGLPLTIIQIVIFSLISTAGMFLFAFFMVASIVLSMLAAQTYETKDGRHITIS